MSRHVCYSCSQTGEHTFADWSVQKERRDSIWYLTFRHERCGNTEPVRKVPACPNCADLPSYSETLFGDTSYITFLCDCGWGKEIRTNVENGLTQTLEGMNLPELDNLR